MKFTLGWLKEYLETSASLEQISQTLTSIGLEVESIQDKAAELEQFKVAEILETRPHPEAEKLQICMVNTGNETLQIVCGAPNARASLKVVLAPVGTIIPFGGLKIKASKIRNVESFGMLCSASELAIGNDSGGIIELPDSAVIGDNFTKSGD
jgi:phenylalanyl-tRNA synthetase beta chain